MKTNVKVVISVLTVLLLLTACGEVDTGKKEVRLLYPNWSEGIAMTYLAKVALEDMGYETELTQLDPGPIYAALSRDGGDVFLDAWLPHTHSDYWEKYGDDLEKVGVAFGNGTTGLVVPTYVDDISSIAELNDHVDRFDGEIVGIGSGAGIHGNTERAIAAYDLDFEQITSSGSAMTAQLERAYEKEEPIIITGWKPHFKWANYDLKYLEDPRDIYPADACEIVSREGFAEDFPEAHTFLSNFNLTEEQLYSLMDAVANAESGKRTEAAKEWFDENRQLVESWMPQN